MKHVLKRWLRGAWARLLWHTGLWRLVDRLTPPRLTILAGHCVADEATNGGLPADMKVSAAKLERLLRALGRRFALVTVGEGVAALDGEGGRGTGGLRSMVALSMDDGYRDNATVLLPLLERTGAKATVFLIARPLEERDVDWSHRWFWLLERLSAEELSRQLVARLEHAPTLERLRRVLEAGGDVAYEAKKVLKYEADAEDRDRALGALFTERGGDGRALCERLFLTWDDARALQASGRVELGGHTASHHVLSTLSEDEAAREIAEGRAVLERELGPETGLTFAYPFGRRWDFGDAHVAAAREAGYRAAVTTHAGTNRADADRFRLKRWMLDESTPLHHVVAEACGGFELWRRLGVDLVE